MNKIAKLLIIEDNESMLLLMNHYFSKEYEVHAAKNGMDAMYWLNEGVIPELILLDWDMPIMDGAKFLEGIRSSNFFREIPVIIISGSEEQTIKKKATSRIDYYFSKPFDPKEISEKIQQTLSKNYLQV